MRLLKKSLNSNSVYKIPGVNLFPPCPCLSLFIEFKSQNIEVMSSPLPKFSHRHYILVLARYDPYTPLSGASKMGFDVLPFYKWRCSTVKGVTFDLEWWSISPFFISPYCFFPHSFFAQAFFFSAISQIQPVEESKEKKIQWKLLIIGQASWAFCQKSA